MQTFLPYVNFAESAKCLDYRRLGKQRVEAKQILDVLTGKTTAWQNHPCVKAWRGYEYSLSIYYSIILGEWERRGYKNNMKYPAKFIEAYRLNCKNPYWLTEEFCSKHRATLLYKNYEHYSQFGWTEEPKYYKMWNELES